jgi:small subunit ribosomal protein S16
VGAVIRLQRAGARNRPFFRVVVMDSRKQRDGAFLEKLGYYDPVPNPDLLYLDTERIRYWIGQGAQPSVSVRSLLKRVEKHGNRPAPTAGTTAALGAEAAAAPASQSVTETSPGTAGDIAGA